MMRGAGEKEEVAPYWDGDEGGPARESEGKYEGVVKVLSQ